MELGSVPRLLSTPQCHFKCSLQGLGREQTSDGCNEQNTHLGDLAKLPTRHGAVWVASGWSQSLGLA